MHFVKGMFLFAVSFAVFCTACPTSADETVSFISNPVWLSATHITEGQPVRISTVVTKKSEESISGTVTFYASGKSIGSTDFSLPSSVGGVVVAVSWAPAAGTHQVSAKITSASVSKNGASQDLSVSGEIKATESLVVDPDHDRDGTADAADTDDDNDGVADLDEKKNGTNPLVKEVAKSGAKPEVLGASTTVSGALDTASNIAKSVGSSVFTQTEWLREHAANYFDKKLEEAELAQLESKNTAQSGSARPSADEESSVSKPSVKDQLKDTSGIFEGIKKQAYKGLSMLFNNMYAFYIALILLVLWILRKIWRRYSLD